MKKNNIIPKLPKNLLKTIGFFFVVFILLKFPKVVKINCFVNSSQNQEICQNFNSFKGKSLLLYDFDADSVFENLLTNKDKSYSYYLEKIEKKLPNTLNVYLTSKPPSYRLRIFDNSYLIGEKGQIKKNIDDLEMIEAVVDSQWPDVSNVVIADSHIDAILHEFINQIVLESQNKKMNLTKIHLINERQIDLFFSDNKFKFIIEKNDFLLNNIERIDIILKNFNFDSIDQKTGEIDMRFNYPVIK